MHVHKFILVVIEFYCNITHGFRGFTGSCHVFSLYAVLTHTPNRLVWRGSDMEAAAFSVFILGLATLTGRIFHSMFCPLVLWNICAFLCYTCLEGHK